VEKPGARKALGKPRHIWKGDIKIDLREVVWGMDWIDPGSEQGQVVGCCKCGNESPGSIKCGKFPD
jgi:hypothetical protein